MARCEAASAAPERLAFAALDFVLRLRVVVLSVAGPRERSWPGARGCAEHVVAALIALHEACAEHQRGV